MMQVKITTRCPDCNLGASFKAIPGVPVQKYPYRCAISKRRYTVTRTTIRDGGSGATRVDRMDWDSE